MAESKNLNMVELLKAQLQKEVGLIIVEEIVAVELKAFEEKLRERIKPLAEKITFGKVERMKDLMRVRDELYVYLHWEDEEKPVVEKI